MMVTIITIDNPIACSNVFVLSELKLIFVEDKSFTSEGKYIFATWRGQSAILGEMLLLGLRTIVSSYFPPIFLVLRLYVRLFQKRE